VAGIIMVAVADDLLIAHPDQSLTTAGVVMTVGGAAIYLLGEALVRLRMISSLSPQRLLAVLALAVLGWSALARATAVAAILIGLTLWDHERLRPRSGPFAWIDVRRRRRRTPVGDRPRGRAKRARARA
jgi:low temperature requirement protein LtrA